MEAGGGLRMRRLPLRALVEAGVLIALAALLSMIKLFRMPQGGSITAGSMIPILLIGLRWGAGLAVPAGAAYGFVRYFFSGYVVHPVQFLLDYPIAFAALGLAGFFRGRPVVGVVIALAGRFVSHLVAGAVFFAASAPAGQSPWLFSAGYQSVYLVPELLVSLLLTVLLARTGVLETGGREIQWSKRGQRRPG